MDVFELVTNWLFISLALIAVSTTLCFFQQLATDRLSRSWDCLRAEKKPYHFLRVRIRANTSQLLKGKLLLQEGQKKCKTINSRDSLVVTHPTTNLPA